MTKRRRRDVRGRRGPRGVAWFRLVMKDREATAYHEAGHAVAFCLFGRRFDSATCEPEPDHSGLVDSRGKPWISPRCEDYLIQTARTRDTVERQILVSFAGPVAEAHWGGKHHKVPRGEDEKSAAHFAKYLTGGPEEAKAYLKWLRERARNIVCNDRVWPYVEAVARALDENGCMSYAEIRKILRATYRASCAGSPGLRNCDVPVGSAWSIILAR